MRPIHPSGIDELRKLLRIAGHTCEYAFDGIGVHGVIRLLQACKYSPVEVLPDALTEKERLYAAQHGKLHAWTTWRLSHLS